MSSLTISTTVCDDCQPRSSSFGLNTRSCGTPGVRSAANCSSDSAAP